MTYTDGKNDRRLDDCLRYCIVAGKKALENADLGFGRLDKVDKVRAGVLVGTRIGGQAPRKGRSRCLTG